MAKQLGIPTYFLTLSCAGRKWDELPHIIKKLNNFGLSDEEIKNLSYQKRCNMLNNNSVFGASIWDVFFKEIIRDGPFGKTKYYSIRT